MTITLQARKTLKQIWLNIIITVHIPPLEEKFSSRCVLKEKIGEFIGKIINTAINRFGRYIDNIFSFNQNTEPKLILALYYIIYFLQLSTISRKKFYRTRRLHFQDVLKIHLLQCALKYDHTTPLFCLCPFQNTWLS